MTAFGFVLLSMMGWMNETTPLHSRLIARSEWGARDPILVEKFIGPSAFVIVHHSYTPEACYTTDDCKKAMRSMQDFHQLERGWNDIGYSFGIGGDGNIYVGRGFNVIGAHAPKYNDKSVGICLIGDWRNDLPTDKMLQATRDLIAFGLSQGYIHRQYQLLGHRQVRATECPGDRLYKEITKWPHFSPVPNNNNNNNNNNNHTQHHNKYKSLKDLTPLTTMQNQ